MESVLLFFSYLLTTLFLLGIVGSLFVIVITTIEEVGLFFGKDLPEDDGPGSLTNTVKETPAVVHEGKP